MISPKEHQEAYQTVLAWVTRQVEAAERQGLTLDYLGGWHTFQPDRKDLEHAWRVLYSIPDSMTHLLTCGSRKPVAPSNGTSVHRSLCCSPLIMMMQPTDFWHFPDQTNLWPLDWPWQRTIHVQRSVCAPVVIISEIPG
jgi:hypothetical protein